MESELTSNKPLSSRRQLLKAATAAAAAAHWPTAGRAEEDRQHHMSEANRHEAAPCGLYCGVCADRVEANECHGCGCDCGKCGGKRHADHCAIAKCAADKGRGSCAECDDLPRTRIIEFTFDPIWRPHERCIGNLRRRKKIRTEAWLIEQQAYWQDERARKAQLALHDKCAKQARELRETGTWTG